MSDEDMPSVGARRASDGPKTFGSLVLARARDDLLELWDKIPDADRAEVITVTLDFGALTLRLSWGEDVDAELLHVRAAIASWKFVGEDLVREAIIKATKDGLLFAADLAVKAMMP